MYVKLTWHLYVRSLMKVVMMQFSVNYLVIMVVMFTECYMADVWNKNDIDIFCNLEEYGVKVERPGCPAQEFLVKACLGNCRSFELPIQQSPYFQSKCETCRAEKTEKVMHVLQGCDAGVDRTVYIDSAVSCKCSVFECY